MHFLFEKLIQKTISSKIQIYKAFEKKVSIYNWFTKRKCVINLFANAADTSRSSQVS